MKYASLVLLVGFFCIGCGSAGETNASADAGAAAASATPVRIRSNTKESARQEQTQLAEDEVRVSLIVLPGDAAVEVDNVVVRRRNGAVELVGKVGDERRVRVFSGTTQIHETIVKIEATGPTPASIDARPTALTR